MKAISNLGQDLAARGKNQDAQAIQGVSILAFRPGSIAEKAGMRQGDVIVEYDGVENLTSRTLSALAIMRRPESLKVRVVFVREGHKHCLALQSGPLGVSAYDTVIDGPVKDSKVNTEIDSSIERLVQFVLAELAEGTGKGALKRTLVQNGWDKHEAALFIDRVSREMAVYPNVKAVLRNNLASVRSGVLLIAMYILISVGLDFPDDGWDLLSLRAVLWSPVLALLLWGWLVTSRRLAKQEHVGEENWAGLFKPSRGNLHITKVSPGRIESALAPLGSPSDVVDLVVVELSLIFIIALLIIVYFFPSWSW